VILERVMRCERWYVLLKTRVLRNQLSVAEVVQENYG
jgi:hypothetical protein